MGGYTRSLLRNMDKANHKFKVWCPLIENHSAQSASSSLSRLTFLVPVAFNQASYLLLSLSYTALTEVYVIMQLYVKILMTYG